MEIVRFLKKGSVTVVKDGMWKAYFNTEPSRAELTAEQSPEIVARVLEVWGPPMVAEPVVIEPASNPITQLRADVDFLLVAEMQREGLL